MKTTNPLQSQFSKAQSEILIFVKRESLCGEPAAGSRAFTAKIISLWNILSWRRSDVSLTFNPRRSCDNISETVQATQVRPCISLVPKYLWSFFSGELESESWKEQSLWHWKRISNSVADCVKRPRARHRIGYRYILFKRAIIRSALQRGRRMVFRFV